MSRVGGVLARCAPLLSALGLLVLALPPECAAAQADPGSTAPAWSQDRLPGTPIRPSSAGDEEGLHVRISLEEQHLYLMDGDRVVWQAVIGTGTGETLEGAGQVWDFSTPRGDFMVQRKELEPVWNLPDWVFVQRGEPVPPPGSPLRRVEGMLGDAALYLSPEIAIHGTDEPDQLGHEVSHGCIRMTNEDVMRLYEQVDVGTPVIVY